MGYLREKSYRLVLAGMGAGAVLSFAITQYVQSRNQESLKMYQTSWESYFTAQAIAALREGNWKKAERDLQARLNAQIQAVGVELDHQTRYKADYIQILKTIFRHRQKYPYSTLSSKKEAEIKKILTQVEEPSLNHRPKP